MFDNMELDYEERAWVDEMMPEMKETCDYDYEQPYYAESQFIIAMAMK